MLLSVVQLQAVPAGAVEVTQETTVPVETAAVINEDVPPAETREVVFVDSEKFCLAISTISSCKSSVF